MSERHAPRRFLFTIDVDWIPGSDVGLRRLYEFAEEEGLAATLFVTGRFAEAYPAIIREGVERGFDVGTHGWQHPQGGKLDEDFQLASYDEQRRWLELSTEAVERAAGVRPAGFRAPNLWVSETTLRVLNDLGYTYDSSIPVRRLSVGYNRRNSYRYFRAPLSPYYPAPDDLATPGSGRILEIPPSTYVVPVNMSALRVLGLAPVKWAVRRLAARTPVLVFYAHPAEFESPEQHDMPTDVPERFRKGLGPQNLELLREFVTFVKGLGYRSVASSSLRS